MKMVGFSTYWSGCKIYTSQHETMIFCVLTDLQMMGNF
jgi:hypothetical protein